MEVLESMPKRIVSQASHIDSLIRTVATEKQGLAVLQAALSQGLSASMLQVAELIEGTGGRVLLPGRLAISCTPPRPATAISG
jgi:hypothetical protein